MPDGINPEKIRQMDRKELEQTARSIRKFLIEKVSKTGGHLSANLGTVELTLALFRTFDFPKDKVIFDVGHQTYTYKLLTGRKDGFDTLREFGGMSGFPKSRESEYDAFDTGHSSTSVSAGVGMVLARDLKGEDHYVVSVIGDGSMTGGEAYEALNNAALLKSNFIIILNDNNHSISGNVGGLKNCLAALRSGKRYNRVKTRVKERLGGSVFGNKVVRFIGNAMDSLKEVLLPSGMIFENLGIMYLGPVNGHDVLAMEKLLKRAKELDQPVVIHVVTKKGKGYGPAERKPGKFHGIGPFDPKTGLEKKKAEKTYSDVFGEFALEAAKAHPDVVAVTAAMGTNVGLSKFAKYYPERFFDVGIAEQHAVTCAAGMAKAGLHPFVAVFSSFLQRAYDQIVHDVCLQKLPVTFAVDRAGLVGHDGETHQGAFDIAYLLPVPNLTILAPKNGRELTEMLEFARNVKGPSAVRYPRGTADFSMKEYDAPVEYGKAETLCTGERAALLAFGNFVRVALDAANVLQAAGIHPTVVNMRFIKPWDEALVKELLNTHDLLVTLEDGVVSGGIGEHIAAYAAALGTSSRVVNMGLPDAFVPQGSVQELFASLKLDAESIADRVRTELEK